MKKIIFTFLLAIFCIGCVPENQKHKGPESTWTYVENNGSSGYAKYKQVTIDGHEYIIFTNQDVHSGGISVIHSESCPCKY